jgi:hypothetical protein
MCARQGDRGRGTPAAQREASALIARVGAAQGSDEVRMVGATAAVDV